MKLNLATLNEQLVTHHRRIGLWVLLTVSVLFGCQLVVKWLSRPHHIEKLAAQFAAASALQVDPAVAVSKSGDLAALFRSTENGVGIFIADLKANKERKLQEALDSEYYTKARTARVWGWSADDSFFAYTWGDEKGNTTLYICNRTGEEEVSRVQLPNGLRTMKWTGPDTLVFIDWTTNLVYLKRSGTRWHQVAVWPLPVRSGRPGLEVLDSETVAICWLGGGEIWQLQLATGKTEKLYSASSGNTIGAFRYDPVNRAILLAESARKATTSSLIRLARTEEGWTRRDVGHWPTVRAIEWVNAGNGFALHIRQGDNNYLLIKPGPFESEAIHFKGGGVLGILTVASTGAVYAVASVSNEPPAIWACNGNTKTCIYSLHRASDATPPYQPVLTASAPFDGHNARFELVPPANFSRKKKYPLVIGLAGYTWSPVPHAVCAQTLANAGAYVALSGFTFQADLQKASLEHVNNINAIYNIMTANPNVDPDRVYLFAFSGSVITIYELLKQYPGRFNGIILLHPGPLPEPQIGMCKRVLLTYSVDEAQDDMRITEFQEALCRIGIQSEVFFHQAGGHIARAQRIMRERAELMTKFVFE